MFRKTTALFIAALFFLSAVAAAGSEAGVFGELIDSDCTDERLSALDQAAETISVSQTAGDATVEVCQAYYEGNRIFVSYRASGSVMVLDGLEMNDGAYADIIAGGEKDAGNGMIIGWKECIVPEDELAETQTFYLAYRAGDSGEKGLLQFTVKQHAYDQYLQGASQTGSYQAWAILYMGKVDLKGIVSIRSSEQAAGWIAWQEGEEGTGTDVIACWNLYRNGEFVSGDLFGASEVNGTEEVIFAVMFPFMEDLSGLTLVPEYSEAGEKTDEALVLEPADPE